MNQLQNILGIGLCSIGILGCGGPRVTTFKATFNSDECKIAFNDSVKLKEFTVSQSTMHHASPFKPLDENQYIQEIKICSPDTLLYKVDEQSEHERFDPNKPFWLELLLDNNSKENRFYKCYMNSVPKRDTIIEFDNAPMAR